MARCEVFSVRSSQIRIWSWVGVNEPTATAELVAPQACRYLRFKHQDKLRYLRVTRVIANNRSVLISASGREYDLGLPGLDYGLANPHAWNTIIHRATQRARNQDIFTDKLLDRRRRRIGY